MSASTRKKLTILGIMAVLAITMFAPSFGARAISGAIANVSAADGATIAPVGFRVYSALPGGETNINDNTASCRNMRCMRGYSTNALLQPGGFITQQEATRVWNGDIPDQPFYYLADACLNDSATNHIGWYAVAGVTANNSGIGNFLMSGCPSTTATVCFSRADNDVARNDLFNTYYGYGVAGNSHAIRHIGGLNPIPNVRVKVGSANSCPPGFACLTWDDVETYDSLMRPSNTGAAPPSPVQGVTLYRNDNVGSCLEPAGNDPRWTPVASFPIGTGPNGAIVPMPPDTCSYFAFRVVVTGPGGLTNKLETACLGVHSQPVATTPTAVRISRFDVRYAGQGIVNVRWTSGIEGDVSGFYVARGASATGPFARVSGLVPTRGDDSDYSVNDRVGGRTGRVYYYQLQILGRDGSVTTNTPAAVTLPGRSKKALPFVR